MKTIPVILSLLTLLLFIPDSASTKRIPDIKKYLRSSDTSASFSDIKRKIITDTTISVTRLVDIANKGLTESGNTKNKDWQETSNSAPPKIAFSIRHVIVILLIGIGPRILIGRAKMKWERVSEDEERIK